MTAARDAGVSVIDAQKAPVDVAVAFSPPPNVSRFGTRDHAIAVVQGDVAAWSASGALDVSTAVVVPNVQTRDVVDAEWGSGIATVVPEANSGGRALFEALLPLTERRAGSLRIGVGTSVRSWEVAASWGDTYFARGLVRAFRRLGHEATEILKPDWHGSRASSCDAVVFLRGLARRPVDPDQLNVLWVISHPDRLEDGECDDYDIIASASALHARQLSARIGRTVHVLPQAADTDTFDLETRPRRADDSVLYVGRARTPPRPAPRLLHESGQLFELYGEGWTDQPEAEHLRGEFIENRNLAAAYRAAGVVVADHHDSMRSDGFAANRLFDVLASGGVVVSDDVAGLGDLFGDIVPVYRSGPELVAHVRRLLDDPDLRDSMADRGRELVANRHTLDHRANELMELISDHRAAVERGHTTR